MYVYLIFFFLLIFKIVGVLPKQPPLVNLILIPLLNSHICVCVNTFIAYILIIVGMYSIVKYHTYAWAKPTINISQSSQ